MRAATPDDWFQRKVFEHINRVDKKRICDLKHVQELMQFAQAFTYLLLAQSSEDNGTMRLRRFSTPTQGVIAGANWQQVLKQRESVADGLVCNIQLQPNNGDDRFVPGSFLSVSKTGPAGLVDLYLSDGPGSLSTYPDGNIMQHRLDERSLAQIFTAEDQSPKGPEAEEKCRKIVYGIQSVTQVIINELCQGDVPPTEGMDALLAYLRSAAQQFNKE